MKKAEQQELINWAKEQKEKQEAGNGILKGGIVAICEWFILSVMVANAVMLLSHEWTSIPSVYAGAVIVPPVALITLVWFSQLWGFYNEQNKI